MKFRLFAVVLLMVYALSMFGGCASTPTASSWDIGNRPQMLLPGAARSDIKGLAMGAARSKGWSVTRSTEDQLVMQRPLDPSSPTAVALGVGSSPAVIEVTSLFLEQSGGVNVVLGAELVSTPPGEKEPVRTDFTETYRDALNQSLESLRASWSDSQGRIARAVPPLHVWDDEKAEAAPDTRAGADSQNPLVRHWADAVDEEHAAKEREVPRAPEPYYAPAPPNDYVERPAAPLAPVPSAQPPAAVQSGSTPAPEPRYAGSSPAPVVDGYSETRPYAPSPPPQPLTLPAAPTEPVPPEENLLTLSETSGTGSWAYYAEQYARLRGCSVAGQGSILIESRSDGEIHKVPCQGSDSFLVKCQNGVCRDLQ